jgi:hypothetical protein
MVDLGERGFYRTNRALLAALLGIALFVWIALLFTSAVSNPVTPTPFNLNAAPNSNFRFWILAEETYHASLFIEQPAELGRKTFDLVTGCQDNVNTPPHQVQTPQLIIRSVRNQRVVIQRGAKLINPPADECATTTGGRVFSLGEFAIAPGRYLFELKFSDEIPSSMSFPAELSISCCGKIASTHTALGKFTQTFPFLLFPFLALVFAVLASILFVRAVKFLYNLQFQLPDR